MKLKEGISVTYIITVFIPNVRYVSLSKNSKEELKSLPNGIIIVIITHQQQN